MTTSPIKNFLQRKSIYNYFFVTNCSKDRGSILNKTNIPLKNKLITQGDFMKTIHTPSIQAFFDETTFTVTYLVSHPETHECAVIDSVLNFDQASGQTSTLLADQLIESIKKQGLTLKWIMETHVHADHLSAAPYLKKHLGGQIVIGNRIKLVQQTFGELLNVETSFLRDGSQFDVLVSEGDQLSLGDRHFSILHTPGHTPACVTYVIEDACFVGDTLFMPDFGTARCDFPGGNVSELYQSIQKILSLPATTRVFTCHDYKAENRNVFAWESTIDEQKRNNIHINNKIDEAMFCEMRKKKDKTLSMPKLIWPSVQINMRAGNMPEPEKNGVSYLKTPINLG
jgi:glyoxylase-like metal-dependent hydrolase (beta-lactamase superfamily II)